MKFEECKQYIEESISKQIENGKSIFIKECDTENQFMTFEDLVILTCKSNIHLNIEIKHNDFDVQKLFDIINK